MRRPFVEAMANAMQERLEANEHKDGMGFDDLSDVLVKLLEEVHELARAAQLDDDPNDIIKEAADVANVAGMVAAWRTRRLPLWTEKICNGMLGPKTTKQRLDEFKKELDALGAKMASFMADQGRE